jgi:hypothetical protein
MIKPSQIVLFIPPLVGTLGRSELEAAAAVMVSYLAEHGDEWEPIPAKGLGEWLHSLANTDHFVTLLLRNPFVRTDFSFAEGTEEKTIPQEAIDLIVKKWGARPAKEST